MNTNPNDDINAADEDGFTPLMNACLEADADCVRELLAAGADVNAVENDGGTALHLAAVNGYADCCKLLLEHGANPAARSVSGGTPLHSRQTTSRSRQRSPLCSKGGPPGRPSLSPPGRKGSRRRCHTGRTCRACRAR